MNKGEIEKEEFIFKFLFVGEIGVGKTSLIKRYVENNFSDTYKSTIGVDFAVKEVNNHNDSLIILQVKKILLICKKILIFFLVVGCSWPRSKKL